MDTPFQWGAANLTWSPTGYELHVPMFLEARATIALDRSDYLSRLPGADVSASLRAGVKSTGESGTSFEPGELVIASPSLFDVDPQELRRVFDELGAQCQEYADREEADDHERARAFLEALRQGP
jgi:hypothetical protein